MAEHLRSFLKSIFLFSRSLISHHKKDSHFILWSAIRLYREKLYCIWNSWLHALYKAEILLGLGLRKIWESSWTQQMEESNKLFGTW